MIAVVVAGFSTASSAAVAQETKPVPKDSMRVAIPGCTKGQIFTAARRTQDEPGSVDVPEGTHIRMNGPKSVISEIRAHEGSMIQLVGLMKKSQYLPGGVGVGGGVRIGPGSSSPTGSNGIPSPGAGQAMIDVEGWRPISGSCPSR